MAFPYPAELPLNEFKSVVSSFRSGTVVEDRAAVAHNFWVVQGYAQSQLIGNVVGESFESQAVADEGKALAAMESVVAQAESGTAEAQVAIPWGVILQFAVSELLKLLKKN